MTDEPGPTHRPYGQPDPDPYGQQPSPYGQGDPYGPPPTGQAYPYGQQAYGAPQPGTDKRPGTVTAAGWITIVFSGLTFVLLGLGILVFVVARDDFVREIQTVPEFQDSGLDPDAAVGAVIAVLGFLMLWALIAIVLAVFVMRRSNVARILLVISSAVTALFSLLGLSNGGGSAPTLLAAVATIVLLFVGGASDWFRRTPSHASGYTQAYPSPGQHGAPNPYGDPYGQAPTHPQSQYPTPQQPQSQYPTGENPYGQPQDPYGRPSSENPYGQQPPPEGGQDRPGDESGR